MKVPCGSEIDNSLLQFQAIGVRVEGIPRIDLCFNQHNDLLTETTLQRDGFDETLYFVGLRQPINVVKFDERLHYRTLDEQGRQCYSLETDSLFGVAIGFRLISVILRSKDVGSTLLTTFLVARVVAIM